MNTQRTLLIVTVVGGLLSGPWYLKSAALSQPPLQWADLSITFVGCIIGLLLVLGFQVVIGNIKTAFYGWRFFVFCGLFFLAVGISALTTALFGVGLTPVSFLFFTMGAGICLATLLCKYFFSEKWSHLTHPSSGTR